LALLLQTLVVVVVVHSGALPAYFRRHLIPMACSLEDMERCLLNFIGSTWMVALLAFVQCFEGRKLNFIGGGG
jgi:uncharacterized membrane protein